MTRRLSTALVPLVRIDGHWLRCLDCDDAFWADFRSTALVQAKALAHRAKAHGAHPRKAPAGRPQRRAAAAVAPAGLVDVSVAVNAFMAARAGNAHELGRGVARIGYPFGPDHVLKVAKNGQRAHNVAEFKAYNSAPDWAKPLLAPAVAIAPDGSWLLVARAERVGEATWGQCESLGRALRGKVRDLHPGNVGWLNGRWVATDYAGGMNARAPW